MLCWWYFLLQLPMCKKNHLPNFKIVRWYFWRSSITVCGFFCSYQFHVLFCVPIHFLPQLCSTVFTMEERTVPVNAGIQIHALHVNVTVALIDALPTVVFRQHVRQEKLLTDLQGNAASGAELFHVSVSRFCQHPTLQSDSKKINFVCWMDVQVSTKDRIDRMLRLHLCSAWRSRNQR